MRNLALACVQACALAGALLLSGCAGLRAPAPEPRLMAGQMLLVGFRGAEPVTPAGSGLPILRQVRELGLGGVILFDVDAEIRARTPGADATRNVVSPEQVARLNAALQAEAGKAGLPPLFVAVDQEGGRVQRLKPERGFPGSPSASALCPGGDAEPALKAGRGVGRTLAGLGFNLDFAPDADVDVNPHNPVIGGLGRSFSADPAQVAACAGAFARGLRENGVLTAPKHFPGHGSSTSDSHLGFTDVSATWSEAELIPFRELTRQGLADMVMTAHVFNARIDAKHPATLSRAAIGGLLRRDLGWKGVVVTDDMQMRAVSAHYGLKEAIFLAVDAGADILLLGNNLSYDEKLPEKALAALMELVAEGRISPERLRQSWERIQDLKARLR